jgi:hypothetical protein
MRNTHGSHNRHHCRSHGSICYTYVFPCHVEGAMDGLKPTNLVFLCRIAGLGTAIASGEAGSATRAHGESTWKAKTASGHDILAIDRARRAG